MDPRFIGNQIMLLQKHPGGNAETCPDEDDFYVANAPSEALVALRAWAVNLVMTVATYAIDAAPFSIRRHAERH